MICVTNKDKNSDVLVVNYLEYDDSTKKKAEELFKEYANKNIIINSAFEDATWFMTNEVNVIKLDFLIDEIKHKKAYEKNQIFCTYNELVDIVKTYIVLTMSRRTIGTIDTFFGFFKNVLQNTDFFSEAKVSKFLTGYTISEKTQRTTETAMLLELLGFLPIKYSELYTEYLQESLSLMNDLMRNKTVEVRRRTLAEFQSLFYFNNLINQYWEYIADSKDKDMYYPLYLWWNITNILPLRPKEFVVTPLDCLRYSEDGNIYLKVRRSVLKGQKGLTQVLQHNLNDDYTLKEYPINKFIADMIEDYRERMAKYKKSNNLLLNKDGYLTCTCQNDKHKAAMISRSYHEDTFLPNNLNVLLDRFYRYILSGTFGLDLIYRDDDRISDKKYKLQDDRYLTEKEIMVINPGDTRHFAMINMVLNDFNPILIKDFAGHSDVNTSYHYFMNISKLVKCSTYLKYRELKNRKMDKDIFESSVDVNLNQILFALDEDKAKFVFVDEGKCYSERFINKDIADCRKVFADCTICDYFHRTEMSNTDDMTKRIALLEKELDEEGFYLGYLLELYNRNHDVNAEIHQSLLKIQTKANQYSAIEDNLNKECL